MKNNQEVKEYTVLGFKVKLRPDLDDEESILPDDVVALVENQAKSISVQVPGLNTSQLAILSALKLAEDKLKLENEFKLNINRLEQKATKTLQMLESESLN